MKGADQTRESRANVARASTRAVFTPSQNRFLDFVLSHYVSVGVEELDPEKLRPLINIKHHNSIADAQADLGRPEEIGRLFRDFQRYLYEPRASA